MNRKSVWNGWIICVSRAIASILCGLSLLLFSGCGGSKAAPVSIAFTQGQAPPSSVMATSSTQIAATVTNDTQNLGVSWLLTCGAPIAECGSITRHTASGEPATYVAPATVPSGGTVTIQANSSAVPSAGLTATITITPYVSGPISVAFNPALPASVTIGTVLPVSVVVTNDVIGSNGKPEGATLSVTCQVAGTCGYFSGTYYVPPTTVPAGNTVTITATSVADPSASASGTVTILPPVVTISLAGTPPASIPAGSATNLSAYVTDGTAANTAGQMGVDWSISCGGSACGSVNPPHTANAPLPNRQPNGQVTTSFAAPSTVPPGGTVTITASATAEPTVQASVTITITPVTLNDGLLSGQYAFFLSGVNTAGLTALGGSLIADGNGSVTAAEESVPGQGTALTGISGSYYIGSDGRGLMTLNGLSNVLWLNGQQIFSLAVVDSTRVFIQEFDGSAPFNIGNTTIIPEEYGETVRGELDLQQTSDFSSPPSGPYAFAFTEAAPVPYAGYYGGVLTGDGAGNIPSFTVDRYVDGATTSVNSAYYGPGFFGTVDSFGYGSANIGPYYLNYFVVDSGHLIVIGGASTDSSGLPSGHIYSQPATLPSFEGTYVFTLAGSNPLFSTSGSSVAGSNPQALGGWITSDSNGNLSGYLDVNKNGVVQSASISGTLTASTVPGRWLMTLQGGAASAFALYPTSNNGLLLFQLDFGRSGIGTVALQSSSAPAISGDYSVSIQQPGGINGGRSASKGVPAGLWNDLSGQIIASSSSSISGTLDIDQLNGVFSAPSGNLWSQTPDQAVTGAFSSGAQGRFTGTITINQNVTAPGQLGTLGEIFYIIDSSNVMLLESDSTVGIGTLELQNF